MSDNPLFFMAQLVCTNAAALLFSSPLFFGRTCYFRLSITLMRSRLGCRAKQMPPLPPPPVSVAAAEPAGARRVAPRAAPTERRAMLSKHRSVTVKHAKTGEWCHQESLYLHLQHFTVAICQK